MNAITATFAFICAVITVHAQNTAEVHVDTEASYVVQLNDSNFEKLTQAATGSTTGPWFIKFYAPWCSHCRQMAPAWERAAKELKGVVNVADVDATRSPNVAKRFEIKGYPTIILIDKGRMYHYKHGERSTDRLVSFATHEYQKTISSPVPQPLTYTGMIIDFVITGVHEAHRIFDVAFRGFFIISTFALLVGLMIGTVVGVIVTARAGGPVTSTSGPKISSRKQD
ncbi:Thioredoxin domain-containing protein [Babesia sp. Xinjiang]|uniref:Thioredoxin domain-containing protein n=1 Tax=Babesia sp. Xinjiang TaxID=462227 RepID=UPI000A22B6DD|nr:Thioredoxin domain-containing protein [Babesia sp. Xinjiang]XP_028871382.1 Thioredoxin domain-containing protein [Babesia sp. Xinjiang]ORM40913.1 Thioredoxin domain-containing protein [Babesia sp. Xinjiang]ORM40926.1 Thioredoxin domain-containing protein [Babesia sp. Xinjiang]